MTHVVDQPIGHRAEPLSTTSTRSRWRKWLRRLALVPLVLGLLLALAWGLLSRDLPELQPWHTEAPRGELTAADIGDTFTLADYLKRENEVLRDVRDRIESHTPEAFRSAHNRYFSGSLSNAQHLATDWNRTF